MRVFSILKGKGNPRHPSDINLSGNLAGLVVEEESVYVMAQLYCTIQCDSFGTRPKKMRISQRLFIRF